MNKTTRRIAASAVLVAALPAIAQTQSASPTPPPPSAWDQWVKEVKAPVDWFTWGGDLRFRNEYLENGFSLGNAATRHEQDYFRYRGRLWASFLPDPNVSLNARVSAEPRTWMKPTYSSAFLNQSGTEWRYGIVDNLNVKWANAFDQPLTFAVGRQDIQFGEPLNWWLVADGTPGDGSWTFFLDSARMWYEAKDINTRFDLVYIHQSANPDEWLPTIGSASYRGSDYMLTEQNEQGVIAYVSNKSLKAANVDAYFMYKHDDRENFRRGYVSMPSGDNADIYTVGGRLHGRPWSHLSYSLEGAYQFGTKEDRVSGSFEERDLRAYGFNGKTTYHFNDRLNNQACFVFEYLSGDDPNTGGTDEMFDILWGRWPRWSELYIYSYVLESGKVAQLNNVARVGAHWSLNPIKGMTASAAYNALFAPESVPTRNLNAGLFTGDGHFRGHYLQAVLKHQFNKHVSAHLWSEFLWQGDYYSQRDMMSFLRAEVLLTF